MINKIYNVKDLPVGTFVKLQDDTIGIILINDDNPSLKCIYDCNGLVATLNDYNNFGQHKILNNLTIKYYSKHCASYKNLQMFFEDYWRFIILQDVVNILWIPMFVWTENNCIEITLPDIENILGCKIKLVSENKRSE